jgi:serine/threonine protein kinase
VPLSAGSIIPGLMGYSGLELIAHGSSAIVFRATQNRLNRKVAIKVLLVDDVMTTDATVRRELETLVQLSSSPHIVSIIDTGVTDAGQPYIVMEYCEGGSYAQILKERGPLPPEEVLEVGIKIGEALHAAHEAGIIHRDVKPPNILRSRFGPALTDFGIAYATDELASTDTFYKLTPHHASPETLQQEHQTGQSDLYSLASTMWNLLAGRPPFASPGQDPEAFRQRVLRQPVPKVPRDDVPDWVQAELQRAMAKNATDRHPTALAFAETLRLNMARTSMSTPWQPRSVPPGELAAVETPTQAAQTRNKPNSVPPVSPGGPPAVIYPSVSAPPQPSNAPTSGPTVQTPPVIIPSSAPTSGNATTIGRSGTRPTGGTPPPVVLPGAIGRPTSPPSPPSHGSPGKAPQRERGEETAATQAALPTVVSPGSPTTPVSSPAPKPTSVPRTYKSRPSHVPLPMGPEEPEQVREQSTAVTQISAPERTWFEPASSPPVPSSEPSPHQPGYQPAALIEASPTESPYYPGEQSGGQLVVPTAGRDADDDFDDDEEPFSWRRPLVTAGVIGVVLGLITTIGIMLASGGNDKPNAKPTPSASLVTQGRPSNLQVADSGTSVTLQWKDNTNGQAQSIITARRATDSKPLPVDTPPRGQSSYTVSSIQGNPLDATVNYCFQVTAVLTSQELAPSDPICTERGGAQTK